MLDSTLNKWIGIDSTFKHVTYYGLISIALRWIGIDSIMIFQPARAVWKALESVEEATTPTQVLSCAIERIRILMHSLTRGMLVGHRLVAGSYKSSNCDH